MTKFREYYDLMLQKNEALFKEFREIHNQYTLNPKKHQDKFNEIGADIQDVITEYENRLCHHSEKGVYAKYSHTLSDKFWELIRSEFPKIDDIGVEICESPSPSKTPIHHYVEPKRIRPLLLDQSADEIIKDTLDETLSQLKKINLSN
jgi:hypothetical protein